MGALIAIAIIWFWSGRCLTKQQRRRDRRIFWIANGLITAKTIRDLWNIDKTIKY